MIEPREECVGHGTNIFFAQENNREIHRDDSKETNMKGWNNSMIHWPMLLHDE